MSGVVTLKINGQDIGAHDEESILQAALDNGIEIPTLCDLPGLSRIGACRLCLVEIAGNSNLVPACITPVQEDMVVTTDSERLQAYRRTIVELLFAEGNHVCSVCVSNGACELQDLAETLGIDHLRLPGLHPAREVDASHERFILDHNRCVLCTRCVRVCDEVEGAHTWDVTARGIESQIIADLNVAWGDSESCTGCNKCVQVCPTGALVDKGRSVGEMRRRREFLPYLTMMRKENGK
ncbi:MAG: bidirectional hydrogenase complex protein HoxU [Anaerolineaceae bacterium]|nr:MAG: bidirectional hydrogenase complex protein HoxU [Anaerolineaceae bacterium]